MEKVRSLVGLQVVNLLWSISIVSSPDFTGPPNNIWLTPLNAMYCSVQTPNEITDSVVEHAIGKKAELLKTGFLN